MFFLFPNWLNQKGLFFSFFCTDSFVFSLFLSLPNRQVIISSRTLHPLLFRSLDSCRDAWPNLGRELNS